MRMAEDARDEVLMRDAQEEATGLAEALAEPLAAQAHCRGIDDRQHLIEMAHQQRIEEHLVGVLQTSEEEIALEVVRELAKGLQSACRLLVESSDARRQKAMQFKQLALRVGEPCSLVQERTVQKVVAAAVGLDIGSVGGAMASFETHERSLRRCSANDPVRSVRFLFWHVEVGDGALEGFGCHADGLGQGRVGMDG